jgi:hypothetical protein
MMKFFTRYLEWKRLPFAAKLAFTTDGVFLMPTLVKQSLEPVRKIVGTLSQRGPVLQRPLG